MKAVELAEGAERAWRVSGERREAAGGLGQQLLRALLVVVARAGWRVAGIEAERREEARERRVGRASERERRIGGAELGSKGVVAVA